MSKTGVSTIRPARGLSGVAVRAVVLRLSAESLDEAVHAL